MNKFKEKEIMNKRLFANNTWYNWYNWLINYIPQPIKNGAQF